jgi:hypothetical protein
LTAAEIAHGHLMGVAFQPVLAKSVANRLVVLFGEVLAQILHGGLGHGQSFHEVLVVNPHAAKNEDEKKRLVDVTAHCMIPGTCNKEWNVPKATVSLYFARGGIQLAREQFQQRGL